MRKLWTILLLAGLTGLAAAFPVFETNALEIELISKSPLEEGEPGQSPPEEEEPDTSPMEEQGPGESFTESELSEVDPTLLVELATRLQEVEATERTNEGALALLTDVLDRLLRTLSSNIIG